MLLVNTSELPSLGSKQPGENPSQNRDEEEGLSHDNYIISTK